MMTPTRGTPSGALGFSPLAYRSLGGDLAMGSGEGLLSLACMPFTPCCISSPYCIREVWGVSTPSSAQSLQTQIEMHKAAQCVVIPWSSNFALWTHPPVTTSLFRIYLDLAALHPHLNVLNSPMFLNSGPGMAYGSRGMGKCWGYGA
jgi:hypothetical protein